MSEVRGVGNGQSVGADNTPDTEEMMFEIYWALRKKKTWERGLMPSEAGKPCPAGWGDGFKHDAKEAWMARSTLHVSRVRP